ncbi:hypothetical protein AMTRI_Chr08g208730 [Amborella trichopoda]
MANQLPNGGFQGGPEDPKLLTKHKNHISNEIWTRVSDSSGEDEGKDPEAEEIDSEDELSLKSDSSGEDEGKDPEAEESDTLEDEYLSSGDDEGKDASAASESAEVENDSSGEDEGEDLKAEESDSSEDEVSPRNTIGNVPLEWYKDEEHIGYDRDGKKIKKKARKDMLDAFLASTDDSKNWRKLYDEYNDEEIDLTKDEIKIIRQLLRGKTPHLEVNPYEPYVDWFTWDGKGHPLSNAPEPKRRFIPSKWEHKKVVEYIRKIRKGLIKFEKKKEELRFYMIWDNESAPTEKASQRLSHIQAPKQNLPGHDESYNPSMEYIPTQEEINSYQLMYEEDRPKFIPRRYERYRVIPAHEKLLREFFDRCLDLYLCPRSRKKRINIDPESLKPKLPSPKDLKPYPVTCFLEYRGHSSFVLSISMEASGQWIASGSSDRTVRVWEVATGRCFRVWEFDVPVQHVAWNPRPELPILAVVMGQEVLVLNLGLGTAEEQEKVKELLHVEAHSVPDDNGENQSVVSWSQHDKHDGIKLKHFKTVSLVAWQCKGDYFTTVVPTIMLHQLSKKQTHIPIRKLHGLPVSAIFHPSRPTFFIATKRVVLVYDLKKIRLLKKLQTGLREISSLAIHPGGDNLIIGSREGKLCWFDLDLSSQAYKTLKNHSKDILNVAFHRSYPLFASCSDDCTAQVFHGMVYSDLNQNPLIVPLKVLQGHKSVDGRGVMDCKFHPKQPWLFTAGADSVIRLYCD